MKMTLESTTRMTTVNGAPARIWEGKTEGGTRVFAAVTLVAAATEDDQTELRRDLSEHRPPSPDSSVAIPANFVL